MVSAINDSDFGWCMRQGFRRFKTCKASADDEYPGERSSCHAPSCRRDIPSSM
jgi:hypothetical protein